MVAISAALVGALTRSCSWSIDPFGHSPGTHIHSSSTHSQSLYTLCRTRSQNKTQALTHGIAAVQAYLYSLTGIKAMLIQRYCTAFSRLSCCTLSCYFARTHYVVKREFARNRTLEFLWRPTWESTNSRGTLSSLCLFPHFSTSLWLSLSQG